MEKVGVWLSKNGNWHISNQIAASAIALFNLSQITANNFFKTEAENRVNILINQFQKNNYFTEYNGFDLGYNTLTMSCMARMYQKNNNQKIFQTLQQSNEYIKKYLDKNANYDNLIMSRNTNFIYPFSFKVTENQILENITTGIVNDAILNPDWLDDRYLIGLSNEYLTTYFL